MNMFESVARQRSAPLPQVDPTRVTLAELSLGEIDRTVRETSADLQARQNEEGDWCFELEADATIPAEYIMLEHFTGEIDDSTQRKLAVYLRSTQAEHGGWPLFHGGEFNISASVKAYLALKLCGDDINASHMQRAREAILAAGGAARANVFTRFALALFGQVPWRAVPVMPAEIMLLPRWAPPAARMASRARCIWDALISSPQSFSAR